MRQRDSLFAVLVSGLLLLSLSAPTDAAEPSALSALSTIEYKLPQEDLAAYTESGARFAQEIQEIAAKAKTTSSLPYEFLDLGKTFEKYLGHHYLAFRFYHKALYAAPHITSEKRRTEFVDEVTDRIHQLALRRFEALSELIYQHAPVADAQVWIILIIPAFGHLNVLEDIEGDKFLQKGPNSTKSPEWSVETLEQRAPLNNPLCWFKVTSIRTLLVAPVGYSLERVEGTMTPRFTNSTVGYYTSSAKFYILSDFLKNFPEFQERGHPLLDDALYAYYQEAPSNDLLQVYQREFPAGKHRRNLFPEIDRPEFERAKKEGKSALELFLTNNPDSPYKKEALTQIEWFDLEVAKSKNSITEMETYLQAHLHSVTTNAAEFELDVLRYVAARQLGTAAAYRDFLAKYPDSVYRNDARNAIAALESEKDFSGAKKLDTESGYESFLRNFPSSPFAGEAGARLAFVKAKRSKSVEDCETFFTLYHKLDAPSSLREAYDTTFAILKSRVNSSAEGRTGGSHAHIVAYRESGDSRLLASAWQLVDNSADEFYLLQHMGDEERKALFELAFTGADGNRTEGTTWPLSNPIIRVEPHIHARVNSMAKRGVYRVTFELTLSIHYEQYFFGVAWFKPENSDKEWTETHVSTAVAEIDPQSRSSMTFEFPTFELGRREGVPGLYSFERKGNISQGNYKVVRVELVR